MLSLDLNKESGIAIIKPEGPLQESDFKRIANKIDPYIEEKGRLTGLVIYTESFPGWNDFGALIAHLKFINEHHNNIKKVAAVTDAQFMSIMQKVVDHFVNAEVKHFNYDDIDDAILWINKSSN